MLTIRPLRVLLRIALVFALFSNMAQAAFPDDFNGVVWIDPETDPGAVAGWSRTANLSVSQTSTLLRVNSNKSGVWPNKTVNGVSVNASLWVFARFNGVWHAVTFEYLRPNTSTKPLSVVEGGHAKRAPFKTSGYVWRPNQGEVIAFMVSGIARFNLSNVNIRERSNVALYKWGVGPVTSIDDDGTEEPPAPEPEEECVEPEPENNTHVYNGTINGTITVTTAIDDIPFAVTEPVTVNVKDDRSLLMTVDEEQMQSQVNTNGTFTGSFVLQESLGSEVCNITINVNGSVNGNSMSGTGSGAETCGPYSAVLNATFSANSATTPSYLDERPTAPKVCAPVMAPVHSLLLL